MDVGIWIYPWDLLDGGVEPVLMRLRDLGVSDIHLAASYHTVLAALPHNPRRRTYLAERAALYFHPRPERWQGSLLRPEVSPLVAAGGDALAAAAPLCKVLGLRLTAWTVCLHNTCLAQRYPETNVINLWGERYPSLCAANPHVRAYAAALVGDLRDRADMIELEAAHWMPFPHHHHAKIGVPAAEVVRLLLGLCFCEHCEAMMAAAGLDLASLRARLRALLDRLAATTPAAGREAEISALCEAEPELAMLLALRRDCVTALVGELKAAAGTTLVASMAFGPQWATGADPIAIAAIADRLELLVYGPPATVVETLSGVATVPGGAAMGRLVVGLSLLAPETESQAALRAAVEAARAAGAAGVCFYNYGLAPLERVGWIEVAGFN
jgi:hypothetical protein